LSFPIGRREHRKNGFVIAASQKLDPPGFHKSPESIDEIPVVVQKPVQKNPGEMLCDLEAGMGFKGLQEREISLPVGLLEDMVEVPDRLMVVESEAEKEWFVWHNGRLSAPYEEEKGKETRRGNPNNVTTWLGCPPGHALRRGNPAWLPRGQPQRGNHMGLPRSRPRGTTT
jgi:hypothetical protein